MTESKHIKVLVVDDEAIYLSLVRDALEDEDYQVQTASSSEDALKIVTDQHIDLIVSDIRMPGMNGITLFQKAREIRPHIGVIFMTGYANLNTAKDAIKQGAFDYISKPFELNEIRQAVVKAEKRLAEELAGSESEEKLDRLSDFSQMLIEVGDKQSLATTSLKFVMMHYDAPSGSLVLWSNDKTDFRMITVQNDGTDESVLPEERMKSCLAKFKDEDLFSPLIIHAGDAKSAATGSSLSQLEACVRPPWLKERQLMVAVPIRRAEKLHGFLLIGPFDDRNAIRNVDFKFLQITSGQLAVSLENLALLEETQQAYARLKALQDETIQLEKMATRGEMSAEIGHELNNFLGVIAGNLSLLDHQLKKENYQELDKYVQAIDENISNIKKFTSNLMDLTPISSKHETIEFDKLIREVIDYLRPQKRFRDVTITLEPITESIPFEADLVHIQQILYNLFNNAADATAASEKREIAVSVVVDEDTASFKVTLTDTGCGFDSEHLKKAFKEKFTTKPTGHGFGLLVCQRIIDAHGGKLKVNSKPGQGTTITITFPLAENTQRQLTPA